jgi:hypothetical protein
MIMSESGHNANVFDGQIDPSLDRRAYLKRERHKKCIIFIILRSVQLRFAFSHISRQAMAFGLGQARAKL